MNVLNNFFFIALPYIAIVVFIVGSIQRYRANGFRFSSLSSQFLEGDKLFFGSMLFHWGIVVVFLGHLITFLFPTATLMWNSNPVRLIALEVIAFTFGLAALVGLVSLFIRRNSNERVQMVTNRMDIVIELLILVQVILGCWTAMFYRWGSSWFAADLTPYLRSIFTFNPQTEAINALPHVIKAHIIGAFIIIALIPYSRLVHFLVAPFHYIMRPYQQVMWYWNRKNIRDPQTTWTTHRPKNN